MPTLDKLKAAFEGKVEYPPLLLKRKSVLPFGKYRGQLVKDVLVHNASYIYWLINNTEIKFSKTVQEQALNGYLKEQADRPPRFYPRRGRSTYHYVDYDHDTICEWGPGEFDGGGNMGFW